MGAYLERTNGRVHLAELLQAAGKKQTDLPTLPQYVHPNGCPYLCWSSVLGQCTFRDCHKDMLRGGAYQGEEALHEQGKNGWRWYWDPSTLLLRTNSFVHSQQMTTEWSSA
jgi:hypothetical protein